MGETSKERSRIQHRPPRPSGKTSRPEPPLQLTSPTYNLRHLATLSPHNNGSTLYDSYELRALTYQLNRAMQRPGGSSPAYLCYLKSPLCSQHSVCVNGENQRAPKKVCSHLTCATINRNASNKRTKDANRGFAAKLWNKVKQGLLRSNNRGIS